MKKKAYELHLIDKTSVAMTENDSFYTTDTDGWLHFRLHYPDYDALKPTKAVLTLINKDDKSVINESMDMQFGGTNKYYMRPEIIEHAGAWVGQIVYTSDKGKKYTSAEFGFEVRGHIMDGKDPRLVIIQDFDAMKLVLESMQLSVDEVLSAENGRVNAELTRVSNESTRVANEQGRVQAESIRATNYAGYNARLTDLESDVVVRATNLFVDSNNITDSTVPNAGSELVFTKGVAIADWNIYDATNVRITGGTSTVRAIITSAKTASPNDVIYLAIYVQNNANNTNLLIGTNGIAPAATLLPKTKMHVKTMGKATVSAGIVFTLNTTNAGHAINADFSRLLGLNLTTIFGAGNEPTLPQMDRLLAQFPFSWFDGVGNIYLARWALNELKRQESEKASKKQEGWITPTLLNGATGNLKYRKNEFGMVEFKGSIETLSGSATMLLPVGYRPTEIVYFLGRLHSGGFKNIMVNNLSGAVFLTSPFSSGPADMTGLSFPTD